MMTQESIGQPQYGQQYGQNYGPQFGGQQYSQGYNQGYNQGYPQQGYNQPADNTFVNLANYGAPAMFGNAYSANSQGQKPQNQGPVVVYQ